MIPEINNTSNANLLISLQRHYITQCDHHLGNDVLRKGSEAHAYIYIYIVC